MTFPEEQPTRVPPALQLAGAIAVASEAISTALLAHRQSVNDLTNEVQELRKVIERLPPR